MKKTTLLLALLCSVVSLAQSISGQATYMSKTTVDMNSWGDGRMSEDMKKQIAALDRVRASYAKKIEEYERRYKRLRGMQ